MHLSDIVAPSPTAHAVEVDDEVIVLDEASGTLYLLNATGNLVWHCLDGVSSLAEICDDLADGLGLPLAQVQHEAGSLVDHLRSLGLVVDPAAPPAPEPQPEPHANDGCGCGDDHHAMLVDPPNL